MQREDFFLSRKWVWKERFGGFFLCGGVDLAGDGSCFRARFIVGLMGFIKGKTGRPNYERWSGFVRVCFCLLGL